MPEIRPKLREVIARQTSCLAVPGCFDGLSARLIEEAGFPVAFLSGGAHAMGRFGLPDMGFVSLDELANTTRVIADCTNLALIVDADTGFGNALNTAQTMRILERAGASAIALEDQTSPKRCGHMAGKSVIAPELAAGKIKAAADARISSSTLVIGRTDAASLEGIKAAIDRASLYLDAGADLIFIEGPATISDMEQVKAAFAGRVPLVHNMVGGGTNPVSDPAQLDSLGIAIALHPLVLLSAFVDQGRKALAHLTHQQKGPQRSSPASELETLNQIVKSHELMAQAQRYD